MTIDRVRFAVLGAGTWGLALMGALAENGHIVRCWDTDRALLKHLRAARKHPKLPEFRLSSSVAVHDALSETLDGATAVVVAVPSSPMRQLCESVQSRLAPDAAPDWILCNKGIEQDTLMTMDAVLADVLGEAVAARTVLLSGPSHAEEVVRKMPTTVVAAARDPELARRVQRWFFRPRFRVYTHNDVLGVALGGALKNVIAVAAGIVDGLGLGDNTRAALLTRGLAEIMRLGRAAGARAETFMGLTGVGDLIVTATSHHSRNHTFGELLAGGLSVDQALERIAMAVEGYPTARSARDLAHRHGVEMPITEAVYSVLYENVPPGEAVERLLARDPKSEDD